MDTAPPPHPYGVEPSGNAFARGESVAAWRRGLGKIGAFDDATILSLLGWLDAPALCAVCVASSASRAFASFEDLWRNVALCRFGARGEAMTYRNCWKETVVGARRRDVAARRVYPRPSGMVLLLLCTSRGRHIPTLQNDAHT